LIRVRVRPWGQISGAKCPIFFSHISATSASAAAAASVVYLIAVRGEILPSLQYPHMS